MWRAALKSLLARKLRLALTALAIVLGVGFVAGTLVLTDTALSAFDDLFGDIFAKTDVVVQGKSAFQEAPGGPGGGGAQERDPIPEAVLDDILALPQVEVAEGSVSGFAQVIDPETGEVIQGGGAPTIGASWDEHVSPFQIRDGQAPDAPDEVALDASTATEAGVAVGDDVQVVTGAGSDTYAVSGIVGLERSDSIGGATVTSFELETAQQLFDREGFFDQIFVVATEGASSAAVAREVQAVLPDGVEAITATDAADEQADQIRQGLAFLETALLVFAFVALFVGAFVIFNTFNIVVTQRTRELGLLRALGASRRQVFGAVLLESAVVGLIGSVLGLLAGIGLALALKAILAGIGLELPPTGMRIETATIVISLVLGTLVTVVASTFPARRASRVAPIEALREGSVAPSSSLRRRAIVGSVLAAIGVGALASGLFGDVPNTAAVVGTGAMFTFLGVAVLSPFVARPLAAAIGTPARALAGMTGKLGRENAMRNPRRTASTSAALMIGLGLVVFVSVFMASLKTSAAAILDEVLRADFILNSAQFQPFSPQVARSLDETAEFDAVAPLRQGQARLDGATIFVAGMDGATLQDVTDLPIQAGSIESLADPETILVYRGVSRLKSLQVGDQIDVTFARSGERTLTIGGIYTDNRLLGDYTISLDEYERSFGEQLDLMVFLTRAEGVTVEEARSALDAVVGDFPNVEVNDQAEFKEQQNEAIDQVFGIVLVLLVLSVIISAFGIANTLGLSIYERVRELGLLRAIGMKRAQLGWMIVIEAVIVSLLGALLGIGIGIVFGWAMQQALADLGVSHLTIPAGMLVGFAVVAAVLGLLASIGPAIRASRIEVLQAIAYE
ncbi:MAG: ABC transporter permease [Actinomycetota bacterium]